MTAMISRGRSSPTTPRFRAQASCFWTLVFTLGLALSLAQARDGRADTATPTVTIYGAQVAGQVLKVSVVARLVGRPDDLDELVRRLIVSVRELSHYDLDVETPVVHRLPLSEIQLRLCGRPCTIRAAYIPGEGLYIDEKMRPLTNRYDQSILFHELVHHVQVAATSHPAHDECQRWREREIEAYALQNQFLFDLGSASRVLYPGKMCAPAGSETAAQGSAPRT